MPTQPLPHKSTPRAHAAMLAYAVICIREQAPRLNEDALHAMLQVASEIEPTSAPLIDAIVREAWRAKV